MSALTEATNEELLKEVFRRLNNFGPGGEDFGQAVQDHLQHEHRTLQQSFMRFVVAPALEYFTDVVYPDLRNEASCEFATNALKANEKFLDHKGKVHFPFI